MKKSIFLFFAAILCAFSINVQAADLKGGEVVLLQPGTNWKDASARFAVYFFNNSTSKNQWVGMTKVEGETDLYYAIAPSGTWKNLIYCRMNPGNATNDWGAKWNQSADLTWTNTKSLFTVANNSWDGATTTWSAKKVASTGKLTASSTNVSENEDVTLTPALTSNTAINTIQSTTYSISPATGASISGNTFTATAAGTYTVTATIKYRLNGYTSSTFESTVDATTTITVTSAAEPKHDVLVSWKCGETELQASQTLNVGESTANTAEAPEFKDYTFSGWELGSGVQSVDATANPISITTKASGEYTLTAKYTYIEPVIKTIYCKMEYSWWTQASAAISAYISGTYGESTGVGTLMTLAPLESNVWKIDVDVARYQKIKFIRVNPTGTDNWGAYTGLVEIPVDDKNLYTITQSTEKWGSDCPGTWSVYEAPASAPKRYITGTIAGGWVGNEVEMTYDNALATYSHTFSALTVDTEYKLKVTDGTWTNNWGTINGTIDGVSNDGDGNICFALSTAGDVTVTFDGAKITLSTTGAFKVAVADPLATNVYLVGGMNSWNGTANEFKLAAVGDATASVTVTLPIGETAFKVTVNGDWHGNNGTMTRNECTGWTFNTSDGDCKINADAAGEYIFTWHLADKKLTVTYPALPAVDAYNVTVPAGTIECYIKGGFDEWAEFHKMTKVDETHYTISIPGANTGHTYKYSSGPSWDFEEVTATDGHVDSRTYNADDVVAKWKAVYDPEAVPQELVYNVEVPAGTEACYIAMDSDPAQDGWEFTAMTKVDATHYTLTRTGLKTDAYKYACQASWDYVEKKEDGNDLDANRTWTANDVVAKWGVPPTYTIVGVTEITGANWDPANAENLMAKDGEAYTLTKTGLKLVAGDYGYKVAKNGAWGEGEYPASGDQTLNIAENGEYTIVYTYTVGTSLTAVATKTGEYTPATPDPAETETVYFVNVDDWTGTISAYAYSPENAAWPGVAADKEDYQIAGHDVYSYTAEKGKYANVIFTNKNAGDKQTADLAWTAGKYYVNYGSVTGWFTKDEAESKLAAPAVNVYTIVGDLVGGWDVNATQHDMQATGNANEYVLTLTNQTIKKGTYDYKVVCNHAWGTGEYPTSGNKQGTIDADGIYTLTFTYVVGTSLTVEAQKTGDATIEAKYYIAGELPGTAWDPKSFEMTANGSIYSATFENVPAATYSFRVTSGNWNPSWGYTHMEGVYSEISQGDNDNNFKLTLTTATTFTVKFDSENEKITFEDLTAVAVDAVTAFTVTVPAGTEKCYIVGDFAESNWSTFIEMDKVVGEDNKFTLEVGAGKKIASATTVNQYKYTCGEDWQYEEDRADNRTWTNNDNVTAWKKIPGVVVDLSNQPATLYFRPSTSWKSDNARFAAYFFGTEEKWADMTDSNSDGVYEVANDKANAKVIFCRMNPDAADNKWENKWNQTGDLEIPNTAGDLNTCYTFWKNNIDDASGIWVVPTSLTDANWSTFVSTYNGQTINAVVERSFNAGQNHTLCLPFDLPTNWLGFTNDDAKAYQLSSVVANSATELSLTVTSCATILAGQPYIVVPTKNAEYENLVVSGVTVKNVTAGTNAVTGGGFKATLKAVTTTGGQTDGSKEYYIGANDGYLYKAVTNKLGLRALIELTKADGTPVQIRARVVAKEDVETGFDQIVAPEGQTIKAIVNGQLVIIRGGEMYNVQGQKL